MLNLLHKGPCFGVSYERMLDTLWFTKWLLILLSDISYQQLSYALQILGKTVIEIDYTWSKNRRIFFFHWMDKNLNFSNFFLHWLTPQESQCNIHEILFDLSIKSFFLIFLGFVLKFKSKGTIAPQL